MSRCFVFVLLVGCFHVTSSGDDDVPSPDAGTLPGVCDEATRATKVVTASGSVVDFATGAPVGGATVDIGTAWDGTTACPVLATTTTRADGSFGPLDVEAGSWLNPSFVIFRVHGGDRAPTASDNRSCPDAHCTLAHTIAAPSAALADAWRSELASGGMTDARTRGLVAFQFRAPGGGGASGVTATVLDGQLDQQRALALATEVRFLDADRATLMPADQATTSASGLALVGEAVPRGSAFVGGTRGADTWPATGCLVEDGEIFLEDRTQAM